MTAIAIQTLSQAIEMLSEDVEHDRDRTDQAERRTAPGCLTPTLPRRQWRGPNGEIIDVIPVGRGRSNR